MTLQLSGFDIQFPVLALLLSTHATENADPEKVTVEASPEKETVGWNRKLSVVSRNSTRIRRRTQEEATDNEDEWKPPTKAHWNGKGRFIYTAYFSRSVTFFPISVYIFFWRPSTVFEHSSGSVA